MSATQRQLPILDTKLAPPPLPANSADRTRLTRMLEEPGAPLTFVVAGPGYGKTVVARQWADELDYVVAWVSLDAIDDDPHGFWNYVLEGFVRSCGVGSEAAEMLADESDTSSVITALLAELGSSGDPVGLVLDDFHVIESEPVLQSVSLFLERLPATVRVLVASRVDPPLPVGRWRLDGRVQELRQNDLRFSVEEANALVGSPDAPTITPGDLATLVAHTEGWAAGLQLALLSLRGRDNPRDYINSALQSDRMITDYLVGEILDALPTEDRDLLLRLSILADFDPPLAVHVSGQNDAGARVRSLEARNLLVLPVDDQRERFRFHQLLQELLQEELRWRDPDAVASLHRQAADHLEYHDNLRQAIPHRIAAGQMDEAFRLVTAPLFDNFDRGNLPAARQWIGEFRTDFIAEDVQRVLDYSSLLIASGRPDDASMWLKATEPPSGATEPQRARWHAQRTFVQFIRCDIPDAQESARRLLDVWGERPFAGPMIDRVPALLCRIALYTGDLAGAAYWLEAANTLPDAGFAPGTLAPLMLDAHLAAADGDLARAEARAREVLSLAEDRELSLLAPVGEAHAELGRVQLETGRLNEAEHRLHQAIEILGELRLTAPELHARLLAIQVATARLGPAAGMALLNATRKALHDRHVGSSGGAWLAAADANLRLLDGDLDTAHQLIESLPAEPDTSKLAARELIARGAFDAAAQQLAHHQDWPLPDQLDSLLMLSKCTRGNDANDLVARAAALGVPRGYRQRFRQHGPDVLRIARRTQKSSPTPELNELLAWANGAGNGQPNLGRPAPNLEPPTARELALLELLPTHLTYREIANELCVSVNTVKTYQKSLYRKLDASSRTDAVTAGIAAGLIAS